MGQREPPLPCSQFEDGALEANKAAIEEMHCFRPTACPAMSHVERDCASRLRSKPDGAIGPRSGPDGAIGARPGCGTIQATNHSAPPLFLQPVLPKKSTACCWGYHLSVLYLSSYCWEVSVPPGVGLELFRLVLDVGKIERKIE